jgi:predicted dinucleotide-binding enzyme
VRWSRVDAVLKQAGDLSGKVIVTCSLPMNANDTALAIAHTSSGAEALAKKVRKAHVVSAFSTVPSEALFDVFSRKRRTRRRPSLLFCGDDRNAKKIAARLIRDAGFEPVDTGPLRVARYLEPFSLAVAQLAYEGNEGPESPTESSVSGRLRNSPHAARSQSTAQLQSAEVLSQTVAFTLREPPQWWAHLVGALRIYPHKH